MGGFHDDWVSENAGRREVFDIFEDEQLIGCKLDQDYVNFVGVTWLKMKVPKIRKQEMKVPEIRKQEMKVPKIRKQEMKVQKLDVP